MAGNGIQLGFPFERTTASPIDFYDKVADATARDAIPSGIRFEGMTTYVTADLKTYQLQGGVTNSDWVEYGSGSSTVIQTDVFSGDGLEDEFTLTLDPGGIDNLMVYIFGVYQQKATYSISTTTLTFSTAPPTGTDNIEVKYGIALNIGAPSDNSVTQEKMAVRNTVQTSTAALGEILLTASSGNFSTASTSPTDVTNLSGTITTKGRPILIQLTSDNVNSSGISVSGASGADATFRIYRDSTLVYRGNIGAFINPSVSTFTAKYPAGSINVMDFPGAGTYVYKVQAECTVGATAVSVGYCKLMVIEI